MNGPEVRALLVSAGNGPGECELLVAHLLSELSEDAEIMGLDIDIMERPGRHGPASAIVVLTGTGASAVADEWRGPAQWRAKSPIRPNHARKNWFAEIFALPLAAEAQRIPEAEVEMQAIRAGGPGGQHQNKTSSAIRARWTAPDGRVWSVVVRDSRSQHQNRRIAVERLHRLLNAEREEARNAKRGAEHQLHADVRRGAAARVYMGEGFRKA